MYSMNNNAAGEKIKTFYFGPEIRINSTNCFIRRHSIVHKWNVLRVHSLGHGSGDHDTQGGCIATLMILFLLF